MIKKFDDGSYLEIKHNDKKSDESIISLCSVDPNNTSIVSITSVSINKDELIEMVNKL
jgi:hypothetical protein